jgi:hypothetical protein
MTQRIQTIEPVIVTVTATPALTLQLKVLIKAIERTIVLATHDLLADDKTQAISDVLQADWKHVNRILSEPNRPAVPRPEAAMPDDPVIFRATVASVFSRPLAETLDAAENAIVYTAYIWSRTNRNSARGTLNAGYERVKDHLKEVREELQSTGWPP